MADEQLELFSEGAMGEQDALEQQLQKDIVFCKPLQPAVEFLDHLKDKKEIIANLKNIRKEAH